MATVSISIQTISKELMLACRQLQVPFAVSETLAALVASTVVNPNLGGFFVDRVIDDADARSVVEEAARRILSKEQPGIATLNLQATYETAFAEIERDAQRKKVDAKAAEERAVSWITGFTAKFDQDFDTLTVLYKKIYQFLMLRCTSPYSQSMPPKDPQIEKEVAAALESVFPRVGLRSFVALTGPEKAAQLQELAGISLGIRLFNQYQRKGGAGLTTIKESTEKLKPNELLAGVQKEVEELSDVCKNFAEVVLMCGNGSKKLDKWEKLPTDVELEKMKSDQLYNRQYLCYLLNLQEDLAASIGRLEKDEKHLGEEFTQVEQMVGGRVSVPKEQVYPRFDAIARVYRQAFQEIRALEARAKLHSVLSELRGRYCPVLPPAAEEIAVKLLKPKAASGEEEEEDEDEVPEDLDELPGPGDDHDDMGGGAVRLTVENYPDFLQLPLDFQGFCLHTLVTQNRLLVPGNPAIGVIRYAGRYCVFATERGCVEFCAQPDRFFGGVRDVCYKYPELIHLLRIHEDFPRSSLHTILQQTSGSLVVNQADAGTETPLHFLESNIDKNYEWNEWKLRKEALHMADIKGKTTSATQTALSHLRRESETQVYLPKDVATNTAVNRGTNPPRWRKYNTNMRGEPQSMRVSEIKFDL